MAIFYLPTAGDTIKQHRNKMNGVINHDSVLQGYTELGTTWANEMNFVMNHAPGAGLLARPVDQQSSALTLSYGCPHLNSKEKLQRSHQGSPMYEALVDDNIPPYYTCTVYPFCY